jgi:hypothetical protein
MAKTTKRTITYPIEQKIKDLNELIVKDRTNPKISQLLAEIDYFKNVLKGKAINITNIVVENSLEEEYLED